MKRLPLHQKHVQLAGKMTEFQGWQVAQAYGDPHEESLAVRRAAGLFDISFLGRIEVSGSGAQALLEQVFTRNVGRMPERSVQYGLLCNEQGRILDDAVLFHLSGSPDASRFLLTTNALNTGKVHQWLLNHAGPDSVIKDRSAELAHFALQGPQSPLILERFLHPASKRFKSHGVKELPLGGSALTVARTGYTGEHGYELIVPLSDAAGSWDRLLQAGADAGLVPCGLASRDILRIEMGFRRYGQDIDETRTPAEAGLLRFVDLKKDFIGRNAIDEALASASPYRFSGFILSGKQQPQNGSSIFSENHEVGAVTSGAVSPSLRASIGLGYLLIRYAQPGQEIDIEIRDREYGAKVAELPLFPRKRP